MSSFHTLGLPTALLEPLPQLGYRSMTPIQAHTLPLMLAGRDVLGQAMTGSGKTAAFGLALLAALDISSIRTQALVLCPTRELAGQVADELRRLAQRMPNTRILTASGGRPERDQRQTLAHGCHVVVGTPGRIGKHLRTGSLDLQGLRTLVLDEADRMLDMGFVEQVSAIVAHCPTPRQTLLFSATLPPDIIALAAQVQDQPQQVQLATQVAPDQLRQRVFTCARDDRDLLLERLLVHYRPDRALVFCETRQDCEDRTAFLRHRGAAAHALHGQLSQRERDDVLFQLKNQSTCVLVATDVAARGLDIPTLPVVIITELSPDPERHLHRIGRTGRAGAPGLALSIVAGPGEQRRLERIEAFLEQRIDPGPPLPAGGDLGFLTAPYQTLLILGGRRDKLRKGDVLGALVKAGGIPPEAIGRIDLAEKVCAVAVRRTHARQARAALRTGRIKKKRFRATLLY